MRTVHTSPNGLADVVATGGGFRVRVRETDGTWRLLGTAHTATYRAREQADRADAAREAERQRRGLFLRHDARRV